MLISTATARPAAPRRSQAPVPKQSEPAPRDEVSLHSSFKALAPVVGAGAVGAGLGVAAGLTGGILPGIGGAVLGGLGGAALGTVGTVFVLSHLGHAELGSRLSCPTGTTLGGLAGAIGGGYLAYAAGVGPAIALGVAGAAAGLLVGISAGLGHD